MGHNSVVSSHPKCIGILGVDGLSTGPQDLGCHSLVSKLNDNLGSSNVGIHKYGPDTSSPQLGIKSLGT